MGKMYPQPLEEKKPLDTTLFEGDGRMCLGCGLPCHKGCTFFEGGPCQRLENKKASDKTIQHNR